MIIEPECYGISTVTCKSHSNTRIFDTSWSMHHYLTITSQIPPLSIDEILSLTISSYLKFVDNVGTYCTAYCRRSNTFSCAVTTTTCRTSSCGQVTVSQLLDSGSCSVFALDHVLDQPRTSLFSKLILPILTCHFDRLSDGRVWLESMVVHINGLEYGFQMRLKSSADE